MSNVNVKSLSNNFQDVRLVSLAAWRQAGEISPRDRNGPYVILQEAYDPEDPKMIGEEFVLARAGKWASLGLFFKMPVPERRQEFVFGTVAEVMQTLQDLPSKPAVLRPGKEEPAEAAPDDEMATAFKAARQKASGPAAS